MIFKEDNSFDYWCPYARHEAVSPFDDMNSHDGCRGIACAMWKWFDEEDDETGYCGLIN